MATYIPNATLTTEPTEDQTVESAALEFRTLKGSVNSRIDAVQAEVDAEEVARAAADAVIQAELDATQAQQATERLQYLRVPESSITALPAVPSRAGKILGFDAGGAPVPVLLGASSDPSLRADLAATTGSSLVGYDGGTVQDVLDSLKSGVVNANYYGQVGDKITDDTVAIAAAISAAVASKARIVEVVGSPAITAITVPSGITLRMAATFVAPYAGTDFANDPDDFLPNRFIKLTDGVTAITCYGKLENLMFDGSGKTGVGIDMKGSFDSLYVTRCKGKSVVAESVGSAYKWENLFLYGNYDDALTLDTVTDSRLSRFNIAANLGHGLKYRGGTLTLEDGKIEWNAKDNFHCYGFSIETVFSNCIIDSANWYNLFLGNGGRFTITGGAIIGGRRDYTYTVGGVNYGGVPSDLDTSQIYVKSQFTEITISGGTYCRAINNTVPGLTTEQINKVISGSIAGPLTMAQFVGASCRDFTYSNLCTLTAERLIVIGTPTATGTAFGQPSRGAINVLPLTTTAQSTTTNIPVSGGVFYDYEAHKIKVNEFGTMYEVPLGTQNNLAPFQSVRVATTLAGSQSITVSDLVGNMFLVCVVLGGNSGANYGYLGMLSSLYSVDVLTQITSSGLTASLSAGVISITGTGPFYDGRATIYRIA